MANLHFVKQGQGPVVVLSHALGCSLHMWDDVAAALQDHYTVVRYDHRGHGLSETRQTPFSIDDMADDTAALIEEVVGEPAHFVGLSMGGMVAQSMGARYPQWVKSLVIANSAQHYDETAQSLWKTRVQSVRSHGVASISEGAMQRWFTPAFRADLLHGGAARVLSLKAELEQCKPAAYAASCEAIANIDFRQSNLRISCPTLVIAGDKDEATPTALSVAINQAITGSQLRSIDAAHLSAVEQPAQFARLLTDFWKTI